jgi:hypothetical protein
LADFWVHSVLDTNINLPVLAEDLGKAPKEKGIPKQMDGIRVEFL